MIKKFFLVLVLAVAVSTVSASAQSFSKGSNNLSALVGFAGYGVPITLQYERGVYDINDSMAIGVGGSLGVGFAKYSLVTALARGVYHYTGFNSWDLYGSVGLGFRYYEWFYDTTGFSYGANLGARYFFNDSFAIASEVGYGVSYVNIGVTYAF